MARARKTAVQPRPVSVAAEIVAERAAKGEGAWHTVKLPKPPSLNNLYANKRSGGRTKGKRGRQWAQAAGYIILASRPPKIQGAYELRIQLGRRKGSDLDNYAKALSDLLKSIGVIKDDSRAERVLLEWADDLPSAEARFSIRPYVRTIAAAERKRESAPELPPMVAVLDGTKFKKRTAPKLPRAKCKAEPTPQPNAAGLYVEKTEAGEQLTMIAPPSLQEARDAYLLAFVSAVEAHPAAYKVSVRLNPWRAGRAIIRGLSVDEVRRMTRELAAEQREIERKTRPTPTQCEKARRKSAAKAAR